MLKTVTRELVPRAHDLSHQRREVSRDASQDKKRCPMLCSLQELEDAASVDLDLLPLPVARHIVAWHVQRIVGCLDKAFDVERKQVRHPPVWNHWRACPGVVAAGGILVSVAMRRNGF